MRVGIRHRRRELRNLPGVGIDARDVGCAAVRKPNHACRVFLEAVRLCAWLGRIHEADFARVGNEPTDHVAVLQREPVIAAACEDTRVRIARIGIGHRVDSDLARVGIELSDRAVAVARVPDIAFGIVDDAVWIGALFELPLRHLPGFGIEPANHVAVHAGPEDHAVRRHERVARPLPKRRYAPLEECNFVLTRHEFRPAVVPLGEGRPEVVENV